MPVKCTEKNTKGGGKNCTAHPPDVGTRKPNLPSHTDITSATAGRLATYTVSERPFAKTNKKKEAGCLKRPCALTCSRCLTGTQPDPRSGSARSQ